MITKDDRNTPSHILPCMYALSSRITRQVCIFVLDGVLFDKLEKSGVAWIWLAFFFRQAQEPSRSRDCPRPDHANNRCSATGAISTVWPCRNDVPGYFDRVPLNSVATEPHKARLPVPVVSPRSAGPSSPDLFLLWETTHRRTSPTVSTTRSDPVDEIWRLMAIAVCLGSFRQQTCTPQHSAFPLGDTCHRVLVVSSLVEFT